MRLTTSDLRLPVRTRVRTMARSLLPLTVSGMTWRSCCIWGAERPLGALGRGLGRSTGSQGLALRTSMRIRNLKKEEMTGETGADGYGRRFTAREADAVGEAEDILRRDLIGRLLEATEEVAEGAVVGVRSAVGAGAALFLGEEGVEGAFPARGARTREDGRQWSERWTWRTP